jgi:hypothetical protein
MGAKPVGCSGCYQTSNAEVFFIVYHLQQVSYFTQQLPIAFVIFLVVCLIIFLS